MKGTLIRQLIWQTSTILDLKSEQELSNDQLEILAKEAFYKIVFCNGSSSKYCSIPKLGCSKNCTLKYA